MRLDLTNIIKSYHGRVVLDIESLGFDSGKRYALLGPNGSGKTTLLRVIAGIEQADRGVIYYDGQSALPHSQIAYLPQKPYIFDTSVLENVIRGMNGGLSRKNANRMLGEDALEALALKHLSQTQAVSLSGGEAQKIAILRTIILKRRVVLLDEPTSAVDIPSMKQVEDYITKTTTASQATLIFTTHNPSQALRMADEIIMLWNGRVVEKGPWDKVLYHPGQPETEAFLKFWTGTERPEPNSRSY